MVKYFVILFFLWGTLAAREHFLSAEWEKSKGIYTQEKSFCQEVADHETFCEKAVLSYPLFSAPPNPSLVIQIESLLNKPKTDYKQKDLPRSVRETIAENKDYLPHGIWDNTSRIDLFAVTPESFTLQKDDSGYTGGAHGYHEITYLNYAFGNNTPLTFDDLFTKDYNATLHHIAEKVFREYTGLAPSDDLTEDGWFENRFVLTPNFAITPRGLLFHYNAYEIKPYAAGHTVFLLPYFYLHSIIKPEGVLASYKKLPQKVKAKFSQNGLALLQVQAEHIHKQKVHIDIKLTKLSYLKHVWLSLSFPQIKNEHTIASIHVNGLQHPKHYPAGSNVFHIGRKKTVKSRYLLLEAENHSWEKGKTGHMNVTLHVPDSIHILRIRIRAVLKEGKTLKTLPDYDGVKGQQGFYNYEILLPIRYP